MWSHEVPLPGLSLVLSLTPFPFLPLLRQALLCAEPKAQEAHSGIFLTLSMHLGRTPLFARRCRLMNGAQCSL